ncbi:MAG: hypothetical protein JRG91_11305 [Deltaproteobacteria bacterium]|nr:hypothetical protein [Deltaproteobacteria bacterium]
MALQDEIRGLIAEIAAVDEEAVVAEASLQDDLGIDSLGMLNLAETISAHCGVELVGDDLADVETVGELLELVASRTSAKSSRTT